MCSFSSLSVPKARGGLERSCPLPGGGLHGGKRAHSRVGTDHRHGALSALRSSVAIVVACPPTPHLIGIGQVAHAQGVLGRLVAVVRDNLVVKINGPVRIVIDLGVRPPAAPLERSVTPVQPPLRRRRVSFGWGRLLEIRSSGWLLWWHRSRKVWGLLSLQPYHVHLGDEILGGHPYVASLSFSLHRDIVLLLLRRFCRGATWCKLRGLSHLHLQKGLHNICTRTDALGIKARADRIPSSFSHRRTSRSAASPQSRRKKVDPDMASAIASSPTPSTTPAKAIARAKVTKTVAQKKQKLTAEPETPVVEEIPVVVVVPMEVSTQTAPTTDAIILEKLAEILKGQQKVQRALNKTQKQVALILQILEGDAPTQEESETDGTDKKKRKRASTDTGTRAPKAPSGFAKPTNISPKLCDFLGVPYGTLVSRTEVTKRVVAYVRENNLQKESNKRVILPDEKLKALLAAPPDVEITFFTLQKWLACLYSKEPFPTEA
jgi:hypothetical protein